MNGLLIETARLSLTPLVPADTEALHQLWTQPGVRRYLWDDEVIAPERTAEIVQEGAEMLARGEAGLWGVRQHEAPARGASTRRQHWLDSPATGTSSSRRSGRCSTAWTRRRGVGASLRNAPAR